MAQLRDHGVAYLQKEIDELQSTQRKIADSLSVEKAAELARTFDDAQVGASESAEHARRQLREAEARLHAMEAALDAARNDASAEQQRTAAEIESLHGELEEEVEGRHAGAAQHLRELDAAQSKGEAERESLRAKVDELQCAVREAAERARAAEAERDAVRAEGERAMAAQRDTIAQLELSLAGARAMGGSGSGSGSADLDELRTAFQSLELFSQESAAKRAAELREARTEAEQARATLVRAQEAWREQEAMWRRNLAELQKHAGNASEIAFETSLRSEMRIMREAYELKLQAAQREAASDVAEHRRQRAALEEQLLAARRASDARAQSAGVRRG